MSTRLRTDQAWEKAYFYAADQRGIYIPQYFAETVHRHRVSGVSEQDWAILEAGPGNLAYWEAWDDVLRNAVIAGSDGMVYYLYQDGDLVDDRLIDGCRDGKCSTR